MDWGIALFYTALATIAARIAWTAPERWIGVVLVLNVVAYNLVCAMMIPATDPGVAMLTETASFEAAIICLVLTNSTPALALATLSVTSIAISAAKSLGYWTFFGYEEAINAILVCQCIILSRKGIGDVVLRMDRRWRDLRNRGNADYMPGHGMATVSRRSAPDRPDQAA